MEEEKLLEILNKTKYALTEMNEEEKLFILTGINQFILEQLKEDWINIELKEESILVARNKSAKIAFNNLIKE